MADIRDIVNAMLDDNLGTSMADVYAAEDRLRGMFEPALHHTTEYHVHVDVYYAGTINGSERLGACGRGLRPHPAVRNGGVSMNAVTPADRGIIREDERRIIALRHALEAKGIIVHNTSGLRNGGCEWRRHGVTFKVERTGVGLPLALTVVRSTLLGRPSKGQEMSTEDIVSLSEEMGKAIDRLLPSW